MSLAAGSEHLAVVTRGLCRTDHLGRPARQWLPLAMAPPELMQHMAEQLDWWNAQATVQAPHLPAVPAA